MPIIKSAKKRVIQTNARTERLKPFKTRMLTLYKNIQKWIGEGNAEKIKAYASEAVKAIDTAAKKNIIHPNNASRKKSSIAKGVAKITTPAK